VVFGSRNDSDWERECGGGMMRKVVVSLGMAGGDRVGCRLRETQGTLTCSFLGGADQVSEWRTAGFECWTSCVVESVRLSIARDSDEWWGTVEL